MIVVVRAACRRRAATGLRVPGNLDLGNQMSVLVVGLNHRSAPLALLERLAVPSDDESKVLGTLLDLEHVIEAVVLSTCNRVEVYAYVTRFHPGLEEIREWMAARGNLTLDDLDDLAYVHYDDRAAAHLFSVASGIDSMVVGERQIAVQVRAAMETARAEGAARRMLQRLFRQAAEASRRVRRETEVDTGASSMVDVGIDAALRHLGGDLTGRQALIVGAGKIGGLTADRLRHEPLAGVTVWNRSADKASRLAQRVGGEDADDLRDALADADLVVCTTGAPQPVLDADMIAAVMASRAGRPMVLLDLALPRNVDPAAARIEGVHVDDIGAVRAAADRAVTGPVVAAARAIVDEEAARFLSWTRAVTVDPTIKALRRRAEDVRRSELDRLASKLSTLDDRQREAVEALTRGIVNTLLHEPTIRLKELADGNGAEHHANVLHELFDLDE